MLKYLLFIYLLEQIIFFKFELVHVINFFEVRMINIKIFILSKSFKNRKDVRFK